MEREWPESLRPKLSRRNSETNYFSPEEFSDVFGGPPKSVIYRQQLEAGKFDFPFSGSRKTQNSGTFYDEIFRQGQEERAKMGRNLPVYEIPGMGMGGKYGGKGEGILGRGGFYDDIFGEEEGSYGNRGSRTRSASSCSEVLSPLRPSVSEDMAFNSFASNLRPIIVPPRHNRRSFSGFFSEQQTEEVSPAPTMSSSYRDVSDPLKDYFKNYSNNIKLCNFHRSSLNHNSFSESTIFGPNSSHIVSSIRTPSQSPDIEKEPISNSPSSATSSCLLQEDVFEENDIRSQLSERDEVGSEFFGSYVIEIVSEKREEREEMVGVNEAIAWAKEKFERNFSSGSNGDVSYMEAKMKGVHSELKAGVGDLRPEKESRENETENTEPKSSSKLTESRTVAECKDPFKRAHGKQQLSKARSLTELKWKEVDNEELNSDAATELLNENIRRWSAGKEGNIRSLLSTLQYVLWPNSGWQAIPLTEIIETTCVKKAYQRARLCLHPDKLQQKGVTLPQKYVADKVFGILQDAWAIFSTQDIFS
ncbi:uncharacterized protein LOC18427233 isoform X1 [Amborella trichopoda]|uniref:J domain-containing protein n=1 Tax=Amborella trichopoda TaxID=13333 RepID=W1NV78_AMBTC|nr:uncharacterized protein LOC18427233 isoform X1 [Amborella trichopoda]ERM99203.1 hypothetical protein AMTR_s00092p00101020 [Amborella trichopoda]|eukprot:XP_006836350.1 uncharacterized protein LOC18427233 isoform X1 [Amborella trichopoda]